MTRAASTIESQLRTFVRESNRIEGISRTRPVELAAHAGLLRLSELSVGHIEDFVAAVAPGKRLRRYEHMNVRVGNYLAPPGGPHIERELEALLRRANAGADPFEVHQQYERLHPFMDGNGRSGRAIWLWQMIRQRGDDRPLSMGFLHLWYYQSLSAWRRP